MTDFEALLRRLCAHDVDFIIVGGVAATLHGSSRLTQDLDIVYARSLDNLERLTQALADLAPYPRGAPAGLPFEWSADTLRSGLNFTLTTSLGDIDLFGEIAGGGGFEELDDEALEVEIFGCGCRCVSLEQLLHLKRAAGRPRDFETIAELESIRAEERREP